MPDAELRQSSYIVLGLVEALGRATPYDLKRLAQISTVHFWTVPHTQLYTESARLAEIGLLHEEREDTGRRRRTYAITPQGSAALDAWRAEPSTGESEIRDVATLKLFFGADPATLAAREIGVHEEHLARYEGLLTELDGMPEGWRLALELGMDMERNFVVHWKRLLAERS